MKPRAAGSRSILRRRSNSAGRNVYSTLITLTSATIPHRLLLQQLQWTFQPRRDGDGNGLNGVYAYGAGPIFPSNTSIVKADNYWVDVVFNDGGRRAHNNPPVAVNDSGFTTTQNTALNIPARRCSPMTAIRTAIPWRSRA